MVVKSCLVGPNAQAFRNPRQHGNLWPWPKNTLNFSTS
jgi:hypothetical protein